MQSTGLVRRVDELGRIVIPIELRRSLDIDPGDQMEIIVGDEEIILKKYIRTCIFCGSGNDTLQFKNQVMCAKCKEEMLR